MSLRKIKQFINYKTSLDKIHRSNDDIYAINIIHKLFDSPCYLPFTPFSLNPYTILHVLNDILLNNRKVVFEFGTGLSTIVISKFIKINNLSVEFFSIDDNQEWQNLILKELKKNKCDNKVQMSCCEIKELDSTQLNCFDNMFWYDLNELGKTKNKITNNIDLLLVDGPSTGSSKFNRYPAVPFLQDKLSNNVAIYLDDTRRSGEEEILYKWNELLEGKIQYEKMYGTIVKGSSFSCRPLSH